MNGSGLKEHEKFWAFLFLVGAILALVFLASTFDRGVSNDIVAQGKLRIIDSAIAGLLTIAGMCAQALFRVGSTPDKVEVTNTQSNPVPTDPKADALIQDSDELPDSEKL